MLLQILSDLHLETESFDPQPAPGAELLVLAGDIDSTWQAYERFAGWPVPVLVVAGNHEFDRRELDTAWPALRDHCARYGLRLLEQEEVVHRARDGRLIRFLGTVRWSDFDLFGPAQRPRALKAAGYFQKVMAATRAGQPLDAAAVRQEGLLCRAWLEQMLRRQSPAGVASAQAACDATVVITHFAPSARSADPRFGLQPGTASFCNADDDLIGLADLWIHGHLHARHDYTVPRVQPARGAPHPSPASALSRVVCQARGLERKGETQGHDPTALVPV